MDRRSFLWMPAVVATAAPKGCEMEQGIPPWHMWGTSEIFEFESNGFVAGSVAGQLTRINYHRPESWTFLLGGRLLSGPVSGVPATFVTVNFQIIAGVGRSRFNSRYVPTQGATANQPVGFLRLQWNVAAGETPGAQPNNLKFATQARTPILDDSVGDASRTIIDRIPASDIQVNADVRGLSQAGAPVRIELFSFWAPRTHIRPDWFADPRQTEQFPGGQLGGT